ncbi:hypothetical protein N656DRAFT_314562 [Canariomyces notabilis]|uniref:Uncharacterized protein n=1 Tax=Canariomyces notabilis TaxID=2074819 RepID=A0AAN6QG96_9PEZI|nr:hypothetical protein N656DRAFT_314562 [Canariomyces arenarius]
MSCKSDTTWDPSAKRCSGSREPAMSMARQDFSRPLVVAQNHVRRFPTHIRRVLTSYLLVLPKVLNQPSASPGSSVSLPLGASLRAVPVVRQFVTAVSSFPLEIVLCLTLFFTPMAGVLGTLSWWITPHSAMEVIHTITVFTPSCPSYRRSLNTLPSPPSLYPHDSTAVVFRSFQYYASNTLTFFHPPTPLR